MKVSNWLVRLYPRPWRDRYGDEFEALLEACLHSPLDVLDILLGALDAHLGFPFETDWRVMNKINKLRTAILFVFVGYIGFILGGLSLVGLVDDSPAAALMQTTDAALRSAWLTIGVASIISLVAVVTGGLPLALTVIRRACTSSRRSLRLLLVPVFAFLALVVYSLFEASLYLGWMQIPGIAPTVSPDYFPIGNKILLAGRMLTILLGAIASVIAVWKVIARTDVGEDGFHIFGKTTPIHIYRLAFLASAVTTTGMLVMLVGTLVYGWLAYTVIPSWFASNLGLLLSNTATSFAVTVTIMVLSSAVAVFGLARGFTWRRPHRV
jgi:hypothetical protein